MDPAVIAQQATDILAPVLPFIYAGGGAVANKGKDMLIEGSKKVAEKVADKALGKVSDGVLNKAEKILSKLTQKEPKTGRKCKASSQRPREPESP